MLDLIIILTAFLLIFVLYAAWRLGLFESEYIDLEDDDDFDPDEDWDEEDEDEEAEEFEDETSNSKVAVGSFSLAIPFEIGASVFGPEPFVIADMTLRLTKPHVYADDWYETSRREFSAWAAGEWYKIAQYRKEMGLAA